ncbi:MAG: carboxypeptidase-like regulatory domain-containing protein [Polyangiaceae bacterium]
MTGLACKGKPSSEAVTVGSVTLPAPIASSLPVDPKLVSAAVNPKGEAPYTGPTGTISGTIAASGDPAPDMPEVTAKIPADCAAAKDTYGKLFREGPGRGLADVVVGVTGYAGYVAEDSPAQLADANGCAWNSRTYVLTFGQSLDVRSRDSRPYVPDLMGARLKAQLVAMPRGDAIHLYPEQPGRYQLVDSMRIFMLAEVLVVKFPTHAVTGADGHFVIPHVPVGKVSVSALLPSTMAQGMKDVEVHAGELVDVSITLPFERKAWDARRGTGAAPSLSAR